MLTNAALAGALGAAFIGVLILQLNPQVPLATETLAPLFLRLFAFYGTHLTVACYALLVVRQLFARQLFSPGWISVRILAWFGAGIAMAATTLMWINVSGFRLALDQETARRMTAGGAATGLCAVLLLIIAIVHYSFGRRGSRLTGFLFAATVASSIVLPLVARGWERATRPPVLPPRVAPAIAGPASPGRITIVLLDGASLEYIAPATAAGRLPNFGRLLDRGASIHLSTIRPTQPTAVWAAVATGKYSPRNGVRSGASYGFGHGSVRLDLLPERCLSNTLVRLGVLDEREHDARSLRARPLWDVLSGFGIPVGFVGWPLADPVRPVRGYLVSDRVHRATGSLLPLEDPRFVYPPDAFRLTPAPVMPAALDGWAVDAGDEASAASEPAIDSAAQGLLPRDVWYRRVAAALEARYPSQVAAVRYEGIDVAGHHFLRYAMPSAFGDVSEEERRRHGRVLERQYEDIDAEIGAYLASFAPGDVLIVVSGFGMQPVTPVKRSLAWVLRQRSLTGTHEGGPNGFLLAYGGPFAPGRYALGSIVDVTPTVLYLLGLPVGRDMDGYARTDLFDRRFTADRPITFVPSHE
jgi:predicted AlkP superfamily phosphohydrolase/phosphomutase